MLVLLNISAICTKAYLYDMALTYCISSQKKSAIFKGISH
jgi:hypothetical protein